MTGMLHQAWTYEGTGVESFVYDGECSMAPVGMSVYDGGRPESLPS
jgi:hypothetical protein